MKRNRWFHICIVIFVTAALAAGGILIAGSRSGPSVSASEGDMAKMATGSSDSSSGSNSGNNSSSSSGSNSGSNSGSSSGSNSGSNSGSSSGSSSGSNLNSNSNSNSGSSSDSNANSSSGSNSDSSLNSNAGKNTDNNSSSSSGSDQKRDSGNSSGSSSKTNDSNNSSSSNRSDSSDRSSNNSDNDDRYSVSVSGNGAEDIGDQDTGIPEWSQELINAANTVGTTNTVTGDASTIDMEYVGQLDNFTGAPADELVVAGEVPEGRVKITDTMSYDMDTGEYIYTSPRFGVEVKSNVADGMVVREPVWIEAPQGVKLTVYVNGIKPEEPDLSKLMYIGSYVIRLGSESTTEELFTFTVVGGVTGRLNYYAIPEGFLADEVLLDGRNVTTTHTRVEMLKEGDYEIRYKCPITMMDYTLSVKVDHTPPMLKFTGLLENNTARRPVSYTGLGEGESVTLLRNGTKMEEPANHTLTKMGDYVALVKDQAGNETRYEFTILMYLGAQGLVFFGVIAAFLAAAGIYMYLQRKRMRIR